MKALAAEMVANFGGRLAPLGITVRELTGDMQLTKKEVMNTQVGVVSRCGHYIYNNIMYPSVSSD